MDLNKLDECSKLIQKVYNSPEFIKLNKILKTEDSFLGLTGSEHWELIHSNFLYWLFNPSSNHDLKDYPIKRFIASVIQVLLSSKYKNKNNVLEECGIVTKDDKDPYGLLNSLLTMNYEIEKSKDDIRKEFHLKNKRRLDIILSLSIRISEKSYKINVIIENKILSKESKEQTVAYFGEFPKQKDIASIFVYLLPLPMIELRSLESSKAKSPYFITVNYQTLLNNVIENCIFKTQREDVKNNLNTYIYSLSKFKLKGTFMAAYSTEIKNLLEKFTSENKDFLNYILLYKSEENSENLDIPNAEVFKKAASSIMRKKFDSYEELQNYIKIEKEGNGMKTVEKNRKIYDKILEKNMFGDLKENKHFFINYTPTQFSFYFTKERKSPSFFSIVAGKIWFRLEESLQKPKYFNEEKQKYTYSVAFNEVLKEDKAILKEISDYISKSYHFAKE